MAACLGYVAGCRLHCCISMRVVEKLLGALISLQDRQTCLSVTVLSVCLADLSVCHPLLAE